MAYPTFTLRFFGAPQVKSCVLDTRDLPFQLFGKSWVIWKKEVVKSWLLDTGVFTQEAKVVKYWVMKSSIFTQVKFHEAYGGDSKIVSKMDFGLVWGKVGQD